jgi:hypothetical protein
MKPGAGTSGILLVGRLILCGGSFARTPINTQQKAPKDPKRYRFLGHFFLTGSTYADALAAGLKSI